VIARLTSALADRLSAATYTDAYPSISAVKAYLPYYDNEQMGSLHVSVVPQTVQVSLKNRGAEQHDYSLLIVLSKRTDGSTEQVDDLLALVEKITDHLRSDSLPASADWPSEAEWVGVELDPVWSQEHLQERRIFFTAITVQYRAFLAHEVQQP
jgi:hypothetical protein